MHRMFTKKTLCHFGSHSFFRSALVMMLAYGLSSALSASALGAVTPHVVAYDHNYQQKHARTVAVDHDGNIFVGYQVPGITGSFDVLVVKYNPDWTPAWPSPVRLGGDFEDYPYVSAVDDAGSLYIAGRAGAGFYTTAGAFQENDDFGGGCNPCGSHPPSDAFVSKIAADGEVLYSTLIGGDGDENARAIHLLSEDHVLVGGSAGESTSRPMPTTAGAFRTSPSGNRDAWIAEVITKPGEPLGFCTYFGGANDTGNEGDLIRGLGVDNQGNIWIGGSTTGSATADGFGVPTANAFLKKRGPLTPSNERRDSYIAKLNPTGSSLVYFSWLGGESNDYIETEGVVDSQGNFYVVGSTQSTDFPVTADAFQKFYVGNSTWPGNGFITRVNNDGSLGFSTYFGCDAPIPNNGLGSGTPFGPVLGSDGTVYFSGFWNAHCPVTADAHQQAYGGDPLDDSDTVRFDAMLVGLSSDGKQLVHSTYIGGSLPELSRHLAIHPDGSKLYVVGTTESDDIPLLLDSTRSAEPATIPGPGFVAEFDLTDNSNPGSGDPGSGDPGSGDPGSGDPGSGDPGSGGSSNSGSTTAGTEGSSKGNDSNSKSGGGCQAVAPNMATLLALMFLMRIRGRRRSRSY